ncbi:MAG: NAD(P)H-dependent oxidoreductase [Methanomicrobiales archaeon]|nr:NAD(P)H-dependent oxidoreductase [Methanomicrobiales archaeon]MDD1669577.1 NAD(P)H-dependent oxidoreductase [Methanomicrobiales archaeon]
MSVCIVYHSETGNTKKVAETVAKATGATLIPVKDLANYNRITMYLLGGPKAHKGEKAAIEPSRIDVSAYDLIVVGSPVWAWRPTPGANAAIAALSGCEGKKGMVFATCGGKPGDTLAIMRQALEERKVKVEGAFSFSKKELGDEKKLGEFVDAIKKISGKS